MSVGCHPDKAALWLLAFNLCLFLSQVSHSHLAASATDFAHILTLIMSTVEDKLNFAMSKPGETSISRRTLTTIHSARSNYCIKLSWNMGKIRNTSPRHSRSLILSNGKMSLESIYFLPSNYIGSELAKITNTLIIYKKYEWDDDQYGSKILTTITSTILFFFCPNVLWGRLSPCWLIETGLRLTGQQAWMCVCNWWRSSVWALFPLKAPSKDQTEVKQLEVTPQP